MASAWCEIFQASNFRSVAAGTGLGANEGGRLLGARGDSIHERQYHHDG
jgi:hypothetical protein